MRIAALYDIHANLPALEAVLRDVRDANVDQVVVGGDVVVVGEIRVVNAGSVGMPFGRTGADWVVLGPDVELRHTEFDLANAAACVRETRYPQADDFAAQHVLASPSETSMLEALTHVSFQ